MKTLESYLRKYSEPLIDGHVHMFSHRGEITDDVKETMSGIKIAFADIEYDHVKEYNLPELYKKYAAMKNAYWLATGTSMEDVETIYNILMESGVGCFGFGELKLYDKFNGQDIPYKKISFAREVCKFSEDHKQLPVYIHYELTNIREAAAFERLLKDFPDVPIILCHCGMNGDNNEFAWNQCARLSTIYANLWFDISWDAAKFIYHNPLIITQLPADRCFWGSDICPRMIAHDYPSYTLTDLYRWRDTVCRMINSDRNLCKLFKIRL